MVSCTASLGQRSRQRSAERVSKREIRMGLAAIANSKRTQAESSMADQQHNDQQLVARVQKETGVRLIYW